MKIKKYEITPSSLSSTDTLHVERLKVCLKISKYSFIQKIDKDNLIFLEDLIKLFTKSYLYR